MGDPAGLVVAITGAGSGIGNALARRFTADGATVAGCDLPINVGVAADTCASATECDVTDSGQVDAWVAEIVDRYGRVDGLIANAGISRQGTVETAEWADVERVIAVNVYGVLHSFRAVLPVMRSQGRGRLAAIASRMAEFCTSGSMPYSVSKAALIAVARNLAHDLEGTDILVNTMFPGIVRTAMNTYGGADPETCYPTARLLMTLPTGGPSGRTFLDEEQYPMYSGWADDSKPALQYR